MNPRILSIVCIGLSLVLLDDKLISSSAVAASIRVHRAANGGSSKIALMVRGKLYTQSAGGGPVRAATPAQKRAWKRLPNKSALVAPNRQLRAEYVHTSNGSTYSDGDLHIVRISDGSEVLGNDAIRSVTHEGAGYGPTFSGWLPDSIHYHRY